MITINGKYTTAKVMIDNVESSCLSQIYNFVNNEAFTNPVAIMPDTHAGMGTVIGFTMKLGDKVIPNTIGVDIGCGMRMLTLGKNIFSDMEKEEIDENIRFTIPFGFNVNEKPVIDMENDFPWLEAVKEAIDFTNAFNRRFNTEFSATAFSYEWFLEKCKKIGMDTVRAELSIGTLGGGNHFIEVGKSEVTGNYAITVHTGSRQYGEKTCRFWQTIAKETVGKRGGYEYLEGENMFGYLMDMLFAQKYAQFNRITILKRIKEKVGYENGIEEIESVHNYIDFNDFIIRKGAITSYEGQKMIIPFNMRDGLLICEGKSNQEWNYSAPHGAGRVMSRGEAKKRILLEKFRDDMKGVYSTSVCKATLDEAPDAYKDPSIIEEAIGPTAEIVDRVKPVINLKDKGKKAKRK